MTTTFENLDVISGGNKSSSSGVVGIRFEKSVHETQRKNGDTLGRILRSYVVASLLLMWSQSVEVGVCLLRDPRHVH